MVVRPLVSLENCSFIAWRRCNGLSNNCLFALCTVWVVDILCHLVMGNLDSWIPFHRLGVRLLPVILLRATLTIVLGFLWTCLLDAILLFDGRHLLQDVLEVRAATWYPKCWGLVLILGQSCQAFDELGRRYLGLRDASRF